MPIILTFIACITRTLSGVLDREFRGFNSISISKIIFSPKTVILETLDKLDCFLSGITATYCPNEFSVKPIDITFGSSFTLTIDSERSFMFSETGAISVLLLNSDGVKETRFSPSMVESIPRACPTMELPMSKESPMSNKKYPPIKTTNVAVTADKAYIHLVNEYLTLIGLDLTVNKAGITLVETVSPTSSVKILRIS